MSTTGPSVKRIICPQDNLLVDKCGSMDHLGYEVYSQTLSNILSKSSTPLTIGLFASFGSGKSFLLRQIRYYLKQIEKKEEKNENWLSAEEEGRKNRNICFCSLIFFIILLFLLSMLAALAFKPHSEVQIWKILHHENITITTPEPKSANPVEYPHTAELKHIRFILIILFASVVFAIFFLFLCSCVCKVGCFGMTWRTLRTLSFVAFTRLPVGASESSQVPLNGAYNDPQDVAMELGKTEPKRERYRRRYIMVNFSAWEYAGSDILWAAIITNIIQQVELEIGQVITRLFRILNIEQITTNDDDDDTSQKRTNAKTTRPRSVLIHRSHDDVSIDDVCTTMKKYGDVVICEKCRQGWIVEFTSQQSANSCVKQLKYSGVDISLAPSSGNKSSKSSKRNNIDMEMSSRTTSSGEKLLDSSHENSRDGYYSGMKFFTHLYKHPKYVFGDKIPLIYIFCLFIISLFFFPFAINLIVTHLHLDIIRIGRAVPVTVQILSWLPAIIAILSVIIRFIIAMLRSQVTRLNNALSGVSGSYAKELGFMYKVKTEVEVLERLLQTVRSIDGIEYKVVISIDDLDRCSSNKIRSLLEAVHILLSNKNSPFICLLAVDASIAASSFNTSTSASEGDQQSIPIYPKQYLDKIINIPFYLPKLNELDKQRYLSGLLEEGDICYYDVTPLRHHSSPSSSSKSGEKNKDETMELLPKVEIINQQNIEIIIDNQDHGDHNNDGDDISENRIETDSSPTMAAATSPTIFHNPKQIFFKCREYLVKDEMMRKYLPSNPRSMKKLFNILLLTSHLICSFHQFKLHKKSVDKLRPTSQHNKEDKKTKKMMEIGGDELKFSPQNSINWILLCENWSYRCCYLLKLIKNNHQNNNINIYQIYSEAEFQNAVSLSTSTSISRREMNDHNPADFLKFLRSCHLTTNDILSYDAVSINLDKFLI